VDKEISARLLGTRGVGGRATEHSSQGNSNVGYFFPIFVAAGIGISTMPALAAAVTRDLIVDLAEGAVVVRDVRISRRPCVCRGAPVAPVFG
jgi:hypothetical protein